jgi:polysaccharide export outer membrane protein
VDPDGFDPVVNVMTMRLACFRILLVLWCAGLLPVVAADSAPPAPKAEKKSIAYRITRGDRLSIGLLGERDLTVGGKRVEAIGTINLALIQDVRLAGLTIAEAQDAIAQAYRDGRYLRNPVVTVTVDEYAPRNVIVSGKVNIQGRQEIPADSEFTILEMIYKAGGLADTAQGKSVKVTRTLPDGSLKVFILDVDSARRGVERATSKDAGFVLEPDDIIYVPEKII